MEWRHLDMRRFSILISILCVLTLTGCMRQYDFTNQEMDIMAESMAGLLLKYDSRYAHKSLMISNDLLTKEIDEEKTKKDELQKSEEDTAIPTQASNKEVAKKKKNNKEKADTKATLTEVIGAKDFEIQYSGYKTYNTYPDDPSSAYFSLTPREGNQMLVVSFLAKNKGGQAKVLDLSKSNIKYQLDLDDSTTYYPLLTLLENDLQYLNLSVGAKQEEVVVLVYEIPKVDAISSLELTITKDEKTEYIRLK
mgnify:CR=1 FL=1